MRARTILLLVVFSALLLTAAPPSRPGPQQAPQLSPPAGCQVTSAAESFGPAAVPNFGDIPLHFVPNRGQIDAAVAFYVQGKDKTVYFTPSGMTFSLSYEAARSARPDGSRGTGAGTGRGLPAAPGRWNVALDFVGSDPDVRPVGEVKAGTVISYFQGCPDDWRAGLDTYSRIVYRELWPGIDLAYSGSVNELKYEFIVRPGADPDRIRLAYRGTTGVRVDELGRLAVSTPAGGFHDGAPQAWQEVDGRRRPVTLAYQLENAGEPSVSGAAGPEAGYPAVAYGFAVGDYDPALPLVLDPMIFIYSGFIGGSNTDQGRSVAMDAAGNAYITGSVQSGQASFPVTVGPDLGYSGGTDVFVAKVNAAGTALLYCGYIGGTGTDIAYGIAVDASGNAVVAGEALSTESSFPVFTGPDITANGNHEAFVAKVNAAGTALLYCGFIGGSLDDYGRAVALDAAGNAYVAGDAASDETTFPVSVGPDLTYNGGSRDTFVAKVKSDGTGLDYCGYISGAQDDYAYGIAVDSAGSAYLTGKADSMDTFPVTVGPDLTFGGASDAFVAKVSAAGDALVYCGYIGGTSNEYGQAIDVDGAGNAYIVGHARNSTSGFPGLVGPDLSYNGGTYDAFIVKVNAAGTGFVYGGYIGGSGDDYATGVDVDASGRAYVSGYTSSTESSFPVSGGADLTHNGGTYDGYLARVKASGGGLEHCGYLGGSAVDYAYDVVSDGSVILTSGYSDSAGTGFPAVAGPDLTPNGGHDIFVAKLMEAPLWESRHTAGDFDGDGADELAVDFGASGAWLWNADAWTQLTPLNPEGLYTGRRHLGQTDFIFADLGAAGVWRWADDAWTQLSGFDAEGLAVVDHDSDGDSELAGDFGAAGLWQWYGGSDWYQLSGVNPDYVMGNGFTGSGGDQIIGDFGTTGLWVHDGDIWNQLSGVNADYMTVADFSDDGTSESLVGDFGPTGLWKWTVTSWPPPNPVAGDWTQLSGVNADLVVVGNPDPMPGEEVIGDFGPTGLWVWTAGNWSILSGQNPEYFVWTDINNDWVDELAVDFGALGLWFWDAGIWTQISGVDPDYLMIADVDGDNAYELVADFNGLGLWVWNAGAWTQISANNPE